MAKTFRTGIVGCGGIAGGKHLPALAKQKNIEIVAFCDIIRERAEEAKEEYGSEDAYVSEDYMDLVNDPNIDVIHVLTPNREHAPITIAALESGKDVMCEKPMAKTAEDARKMVEAAERTGRKLTVGYQSRHRANSQYLKRAIEDDRLGNVYFAKAHAIRRRAVPTWGVFLDGEAQGGGPLIDIGTHALDLTLWMMDNYEVDYVVGNTYRELADTENAANAFGPWDPKEFTVEDSAFGFVTMKNGATVILESAWALNTLDVDEAKTSLSGNKGGADMKGKNELRLNGESYSRTWVEEPELSGGGVAFYEGGVEKPEDRECRLFYEAIENDTDPVVTPQQALVVTEILEAIYRSAESKKPVFFGENNQPVED